MKYFGSSQWYTDTKVIVSSLQCIYRDYDTLLNSFNTQLHSQKTGPPVVETGTVAVDGGGDGCDVGGSSGMDIMLLLDEWKQGRAKLKTCY